ncbi:hypothetical protein HRbin39_01675 [bacterium HR39]|nr:hypothetical protein HRbin39_01675 [bacterium HR39]
MARARIGTSGWAYGNWRGLFYPPKLRRGEWLVWYARFLDTVEVNASFYRLPSEELVRRWVAHGPDDFLFAVKAWRAITHDRRLADCADLLEQVYARAEPFGAKLGPILFQLPPRFPADPPRLADLLALLRRDRRHAFEFRDPSWHSGEVYRLLERHDCAFVPFDLAGLTGPRVATASFVYVRLHGHERRYRGRYTREQLEDWAGWLAERLEEGRDVFVYFDNTDEEAHAVVNARELRAMLARWTVPVAAELEETGGGAGCGARSSA